MTDTPNPSPQQPPLAGDVSPAVTLPPGLTPVPPPTSSQEIITPGTEPPAGAPDAGGVPEEPPEEKNPGKKREILLGALLLMVVSGSLLFYFVQMRKQAEIPFQGSTSTDAYKDGLGVGGAGGANQPGGGALPSGLSGGVVQTDKEGVPVASVFQNGSKGYTVFGTNSPVPSTHTIGDIRTPESGKSAGMITNLDEFLNKGGAPIIFDAGNSRLAIIDNSVPVSSPNYTGLPTKTTDLNILSSKLTLVPADLGRLVNVTYDKDTNPNTCAAGCIGGSPLTSSQMTLGQALSEIAKGNLKGTFQLDFVDNPGSWLSFQIPGSTTTGGGSSNPPNNPPTIIPPASVTPTPTTPTGTSTPTLTPTSTPTGMPTNTPTSTPTITPTATPSSPYCDASCESDSNCPGGLVCATVNGTKRCRNTSCVSQSNCSCPTSTFTPTITPAPGTGQTTTPKTPVAGGGDMLGIATAVGGVLLLLIGLVL